MLRSVSALLVLVIAVLPLVARSESEDLREQVDGTVEIHQDTQKRQDDWAAEKADLEMRYRSAKANVEYLSDRIAVDEKRVAALEESIAELVRRLEESERLEDSLVDTLNAIVLRLEDWVARDIPFLMDERGGRIAYVKKELARPDLSGADKLKTVLEALQIEAGYGAAVEVDQERVPVGTDTLFVDVLRVGRVSAFWRTPDGETVGEYDRSTGTWSELPNKYSRPISEAMDMAARIRPVELLSLPLGRISR
jgi:seryl-tRNA synthetase